MKTPKKHCFTPQKLAELAAGEGNRFAQWQAKKHLATCPDCAQQLANIKETWNAFVPLREEPLPLEGRHRLFTALRPARRTISPRAMKWGIASAATLGIFGMITGVVMQQGALDSKIEVARLEKALGSVDTVQWTNTIYSQGFYKGYVEQISYQKNPMQYMEIHDQELAFSLKFRVVALENYNIQVSKEYCSVTLYNEKMAEERKKLSFMSLFSGNNNNESFNWKRPFIRTGWQVIKENYKGKPAICFLRSEGEFELSHLFSSPMTTQSMKLYVDPKTYLPLYCQNIQTTGIPGKKISFEARKENFRYGLPTPYTVQAIAPPVGKEIRLSFDFDDVKKPKVSIKEIDEVKKTLEAFMYYQKKADWENYKKLYDIPYALRRHKVVEDKKASLKDIASLESITAALHKQFSMPQGSWKFVGEVSYNNDFILYQRKSESEAFPPSPSRRDYLVTVQWDKSKTKRHFSLHRDDKGNLKIVSSATVAM
jgi:hypothetical protein